MGAGHGCRGCVCRRRRVVVDVVGGEDSTTGSQIGTRLSGSPWHGRARQLRADYRATEGDGGRLACGKKAAHRVHAGPVQVQQPRCSRPNARARIALTINKRARRCERTLEALLGQTRRCPSSPLCGLSAASLPVCPSARLLVCLPAFDAAAGAPPQQQSQRSRIPPGIANSRLRPSQRQRWCTKRPACPSSVQTNCSLRASQRAACCLSEG